MAGVAKLCCEGVRDATVDAGGGGAVIVVAGTVSTLGGVRPMCGTRIRERTGPPSLNDISKASDLPPVEVGVLCVVRDARGAAGVAGMPEVVAAPLISEPVCESFRCTAAVGTVPALLVTAVAVGNCETA